MAQIRLDDDVPTLSTSYVAAQHTSAAAWTARDNIEWQVGSPGSAPPAMGEREGWRDLRSPFGIDELGSTGKGILIGMLSAFGSALLVAFIIAMVYFFRYTSRGRIFLDRIGRPGEYDDEQQFLREEEDAMDDMDDLQKAEYLRAKGLWN